MKKTGITKRILAFLLCLTLVMNGSMTAFADDTAEAPEEAVEEVTEEVVEEEPVAEPTEETPVDPATEPAAEPTGEVPAEEPTEEVPEEPVVEEEVEETPAVITRYDYKSDEVNVLVTLTDPADLPDDAELVVTPVTLTVEAQKNIEDDAEENGIEVKEIKAFDIKFMLGEEEVQPGATVKVSISVPEFKPDEEASAVYHVDENDEIENVESEVQEDGDVVFDAPHFSVYVIVDGTIINDASKEITVTVKHYAKYVIDFTNNAGSSTLDEVNYQLYSDDIVTLPVGGKIYNYIKADGWKPSSVVVDYNDEGLTDDEYVGSSADLKEITLSDDATVFVYYAQELSRAYGDVGFYDYNVLVQEPVGGNIVEYSINDNIASYYNKTSDAKNVLVVGDVKFDNVASGSESKYYKGNTAWNRGTKPYNTEVFGQSGNYLDANKNVLFSVYEPGLFDPTPQSITNDNKEKVYLRRYYNDHKAGFTKKGNTYTFDQVTYDNMSSVYTKGVGWDKDGSNFYPLDHCFDSHEKSQFANTSSEHNRFFGMRMDVSFTIGDYLGEMSFKSTTLSDFLVVLDGNILVGKSTGNTKLTINENLWNLLGSDVDRESEHTLTILYVDRFAYNDGKITSTCDMEFTLPNAKILDAKNPEPANDTSLSIQTVDSAGTSTADATFLIKNKATAESNVLTTSSAGLIFQNLKAGEYELILMTAPDGYMAEVSSWNVFITNASGEELEVSVVERDSGKSVDDDNGVYKFGIAKVAGTKLTIRAVDDEDAAYVLGGARFRLENSSGYLETKNTDFVTGEIEFYGLPEGTYTLTHIKAPTGCILEETSPWTIQVSKPGEKYTIEAPDTLDKDGDVYLIPYDVDKTTYTKPVDVFNYGKTAKVKSWTDRTYEIDISATALESETIRQLDTTYGVMVLDRSTSMFSGVATNTLGSVSGSEYVDIKDDMIEDTVYRIGDYQYAICLDDGWYLYDRRNNGTWTKLEDNYKFVGVLEYHENRFDYLREVAIDYIDELCKKAPDSRLGIIQFNYVIGKEVKSTKVLHDMTDVTDSGAQGYLESVLNIPSHTNDQGSKLHLGLKLAYETFFDVDEEKGIGVATDAAFVHGTPKDVYTNAIGKIPLYVIVVSDGWADDMTLAVKWATALKEKGITVYTVATNFNDGVDAGYDIWLKNAIASPGCAFNATDPSKLSDIFSQIQRSISVNTISNVVVKDYIDDRFDIIDDSGNIITVEDGTEGTFTINGVKDVKVGKDTIGIYVKWENQKIGEDTTHWIVNVKAKTRYLGGNNVPTNKSGSAIYTPNNQKGYALPRPTVNVKVNLTVADHKFMLYKGEKIPATENVVNALFNETEVKKQYDVTSLDNAFELKWYTDEDCTEEITLNDIANITPAEKKTYYLQVIFKAGIPTEESKENTTLGGTIHFVGNEQTGNMIAVNATDDDLLYGTYTINVWELIKKDRDKAADALGALLPDAEFTLAPTDGNGTTYYGKSGADGVVKWYLEDTFSTSATAIAADGYTLSETKAPDGYVDATTTWSATKNAVDGWTVLPTVPDSDKDTSGTVTKLYINNVKKSSVKVEKQVTGNVGDTTKAFKFQAVLKDASGNNVDFPTSVGTVVEGYDGNVNGNTATFYLKDDGVIEFTDLPVGLNLTVTEVDYGEYEVSVSVDDANALPQDNVTVETTATALDPDIKVVFTNNLQKDIYTGVTTEPPTPMNTMVAMAAVAMVLGIFVYIGYRRRRYDDRY